MSRRPFMCAVTLLAAMAIPFNAAASAAPPAGGAAASAEEIKRAEASYKQGVRLYSEKKYVEAAAAFEAAWAENPTSDVAYNLGTAEYQQGKYREAAEHLSFALKNWPLLTVMSGLRPIAEQRLAEARAQVGALAVKVSVEGAEVLLDGQVIGQSPLAGEVFVEAGAHTVEARLAGYVTAKETVQAEKGAAKVVELKLMAPLPVETKPEGNGAANPAPAGGEGAEGDGLRKKLIIAGIASSAALVTGGVVFAIVSSGKASDADEQLAELLQKGGPKPCSVPALLADCMEIDGKRKARDTFADLSAWTFVAGGVLGAGTVIYALAVPGASPTRTAIRVLPGVVARGGGL
ncbi:MAG TPA: PEGA domain-containing protein, partial [Allosphingosinicella sp.]|nr:PEGA domain-containing protein [Allosphingosinicella sp.]